MISTLNRKINFSEFVGLNTQLEWFSKEIRDKQINYLKDCGVKNIRMGLHWDIHEPTKGLYDLSVIEPVMNEIKEAGFNCLCYVVGSPKWIGENNTPPPVKVYCDFIKILKVKWPWLRIQIWNEPNLPHFFDHSNLDYRTFFDLCKEELRYSMPSIEPAGFAYAEFEPVGDVGSNFFIHDYFLDLRATQKTIDAFRRKFHLGETGDSTYMGPVEEQELIDEDEQSSRLIKRIFTAMTMNLESMYIFTLSDLDARASNRDRCYGLMRENGELKPSGQTFLSICELFQGKSLTPVKLSKKIQDSLSRVDGVCFRCDGKRYFVLWGDDEVWIGNKLVSVKREPALFTA